MKKTIKIISILFLLIMITFSITTNVQADIDINPEEYNPGMPTVSEAKRATEMAGQVLGIVRNCGVIASVVALSIIGLKYMLGSLDEKANYKENMVPYIAGIAILLMCTTIPSIIYNIMKK